MAAPPAGAPDGPGPIGAATAGLRAWLAQVSGGPVRVGVPAGPPDTPPSTRAASTAATDDQPDPAVWLWPYELRHERQTVGAGARHPYRFAVRYVVAGPLAALDRILTEAVRTGAPQLVPSTVDWVAARITPRPVLVFDVPAAVTHPVPGTPLVRAPLQLRQAELRLVRGRVVDSAGRQPVADVRVEIAGTGPAGYTDRDGWFALAGVPGDGARLALRLSARGRAFTADVDLTGDGPLVVRCPFPTQPTAGHPATGHPPAGTDRPAPTDM